MTLREIWIHQVEPDDYEKHMSAIGQAQANASIVAQLFAEADVPKGSRVLMAGAGSGQTFKFLPPGLFDGYRLICSDLSERMLDKLRERVACETMIDDIEDSKLDPGFGAIIVVLVLEHVDYRRALASLSPAVDRHRAAESARSAGSNHAPGSREHARTTRLGAASHSATRLDRNRAPGRLRNSAAKGTRRRRRKEDARVPLRLTRFAGARSGAGCPP